MVAFVFLGLRRNIERLRGNSNPCAITALVPRKRDKRKITNIFEGIQVFTFERSINALYFCAVCDLTKTKSDYATDIGQNKPNRLIQVIDARGHHVARF